MLDYFKVFITDEACVKGLHCTCICFKVKLSKLFKVFSSVLFVYKKLSKTYAG